VEWVSYAMLKVQNPDTIIVGAGAAGSALAYTPGEVTDIPSHISVHFAGWSMSARNWKRLD